MTAGSTRRGRPVRSRAPVSEIPSTPSYLLGLIAGYLTLLSVTDPSLVVYSPVVALMGAIWLSQVRYARVGKPEVFMILWTLVTWASGKWSVSPTDSQIAVSTQIGTLALFLMLRALSIRPKMLTMMAVGFLAGCLREAYVLYEVQGFTLQSGFGDDRADLMSLNQNYLAYCMTVGLLLLVWLWRRSHGYWLRGLLGVVTVVMLLGINAAGTRAALLGIIAFGIWLVMAHRVVKVHAMALLGTIASVLATLAYTGWSDAIIGGQIRSSDRDTGDLNGRLNVWPIARGLIDENRLTGIGAGAFRGMNPRGIDAHNAVLEVAVGTGLVGLTLFALALYYSLVASTRDLPFNERALYAGGLTVLLLPILLSGHWHQSPALWVMIAFVSSLARQPGPLRSSTSVSEATPSLANRPSSGRRVPPRKRVPTRRRSVPSRTPSSSTR